MTNPYQGPNFETPNQLHLVKPKRNRKIFFVGLLIVLAFLSVVMTILDSRAVFPHRQTGLIEFAAVMTLLGHLPGILVTCLLTVRKVLFLIPILVFLAAGNLTIWVLYFISEKNYLNNAGQVHFIVFPVVFLFFSIFVSFAIAIFGVWSKNSDD